MCFEIFMKTYIVTYGPMDRDIRFKAVYMTNSFHIYIPFNKMVFKIFDRDGRFHLGW